MRSHSHDHGGTAASAQRGRLTVVFGITLTILLAEFVGGLLGHSLVLLADAGHMAADAASIGLSLLAIVWASRPATARRSFGYQRAEILAAVVNAVVLFGLGAFLIVEAARRLAHPGHPEPGIMAVFGVVAVVANGISLLLLHRGQAQSLNIRGATWR